MVVFPELGRSCVVPHLNAALFACGSMVLADRLCAGFPRYARKTRTHEHVKYRSAEGVARQLRKSYHGYRFHRFAVKTIAIGYEICIRPRRWTSGGTPYRRDFNRHS